MDILIRPGILSGNIAAIPSKSEAHRLLICAALADRPTVLICPQTNEDIEATAQCLIALGAQCHRTENGYHITPLRKENPMQNPLLRVRESGSTLRFLLPIVGALGVGGLFQMEGRLSKRPLSPLWEEMERMGCKLSWVREDCLQITGKLRAGAYHIAGNVSSQYITGLLFATSIMDGRSRIHIQGKLESAPYVEITRRCMARFGVQTNSHEVKGSQLYRSPGQITVEGDWSNGAFFLAAAALGNDVTISNLDPASCQGDRAASCWLAALERHCVIPAADIPDLVPILAVTAAAKQGAVFTQVGRLRLKESDRVKSTLAMLRSLGIEAAADEDRLTVFPGPFTGGCVDSVHDHRIAMAAAIAATAASGPVKILGAECVKKSYPGFWEEYKRLGGEYELYLR